MADKSVCKICRYIKETQSSNIGRDEYFSNETEHALTQLEELGQGSFSIMIHGRGLYHGGVLIDSLSSNPSPPINRGGHKAP
jgi:hypothetical protein